MGRLACRVPAEWLWGQGWPHLLSKGLGRRAPQRASGCVHWNNCHAGGILALRQVGVGAGLGPGSLPNHRSQLGSRLTPVLTKALLADPNGAVKG